MNAELLDSSDLDAEGRGYPRPQLRRQSWISLNEDSWKAAIQARARAALRAVEVT